jgi:hypothetical protein
MPGVTVELYAEPSNATVHAMKPGRVLRTSR